MDLLMVTELFPPHCSGGGWSTYHLATALARDPEIDITVLAVNQDTIPSETDLPIETLSVKTPPNEIAYYQINRRIQSLAQDHDIVQAQHSLTIPPLGRLRSVPTIGVIRGYWPTCYRPTLTDWKNRNCLDCGLRCLATSAAEHTWKFPYKYLNHHLRSRLTRRVDMLAARSRFVESQLHRHGFERTSVQYNFVPDGFAEDVSPRGVGDLLYVGQMHPIKGPQLVLDALPQILDDRPDQHVTFLGDGPLRRPLEQRAADRGLSEHVSFRGHVPMDEVKSRMRGAAVVVSPSLWHEPLARVVIEAQALGTPVITTNRGGNPEAVPAELIFDPETERLSDKVLSVLDTRGSIDLNVATEQDAIDSWKTLYHHMLR